MIKKRDKGRSPETKKKYQKPVLNGGKKLVEVTSLVSNGTT